MPLRRELRSLVSGKNDIDPSSQGAEVAVGAALVMRCPGPVARDAMITGAALS
jgi:hypothetical protein